MTIRQWSLKQKNRLPLVTARGAVVIVVVAASIEAGKIAHAAIARRKTTTTISPQNRLSRIRPAAKNLKVRKKRTRVNHALDAHAVETVPVIAVLIDLVKAKTKTGTHRAMKLKLKLILPRQHHKTRIR